MQFKSHGPEALSAVDSPPAPTGVTAADSANAGSATGVSANAGSAAAFSATAGSATAVSATAGSATGVSANAGSATAVSATAGSATAVSVTAGSTPADANAHKAGGARVASAMECCSPEEDRKIMVSPGLIPALVEAGIVWPRKRDAARPRNLASYASH